MSIAASKSVDYSGPVPILQPINADTIRIIEFVNGVLLYLKAITSIIRKPVYLPLQWYPI